MFGLFGSVAHELHFCVCAGYRLLICYGPLPVFFFTASKLQFRHRVEGLRTHRFWLARARLVVAFGLFGSVASSFGTMWKGCERTVFGCLFLACVLHALVSSPSSIENHQGSAARAVALYNVCMSVCVYINRYEYHIVYWYHQNRCTNT